MPTRKDINTLTEAELRARALDPTRRIPPATLIRPRSTTTGRSAHASTETTCSSPGTGATSTILSGRYRRPTLLEPRT